jgi:hypothetical protein
MLISYTFHTHGWMHNLPGRFACPSTSSLQARLRRPSQRYSYTAHSSGQAIFLAYCFKHVTGRLVSSTATKVIEERKVQSQIVENSSTFAQPALVLPFSIWI